MCVHNSEHNSPINSDHDDDIHDSVTRISKLDISDLLHLHPNDTTALTIVSIKLKGTKNYQVWSCAMLLALEGKNNIGFIDGSCERSNTYENGSSIADYYHKLNALWKQYDAMIELPKCVCNASESFKKHNQFLKLMQFLMGLDDSYMQIRSTILSREVLPDVRSAYATISSEESHRVAVGSIDGSSQRNQASAFVSNVPNSQNFQISNQNFSAGPSRPNNLNNNRQSEGSGLNNNKQGGGSENKVIVAFDENMCYFLNQDLNLKNVSEIGEQLGHPADPVLNVLKDSLLIDKKDSTVCCEICQRAKQTREPFPLSDHTSKRLGDLVHLDLWGPYKVTSSEGFSDSSSSFVSGSNINTADFLVNNSGNDADSSDDLVATQNEEVVTLEENIVSEGGLDQIPSSSHGAQNVRTSSRQSVFLRNYNDFVVESKVKYGLEKYEVVYMKPPEGYFPFDDKVCRLKKSLYGLKQAPRQWNAKLTSTLIENGFSQSKSDYSLFIKSDKGVLLALLVYVDDIIIIGNSKSEIEKFKVFLKSKFMIKYLDKLKYFLEIEVVDTDKGISLNQIKYVLDLLSKYAMLACKPAKTPLMSKLVISNEASENDPLLVNINDYQKLMGILIYLTNTRPGLGIHIARTSGMFLNAYSDADWANKKQNTLSKSSTEAEYRALASVTSESIKIAVNPVFHERTKHLEIDLHFVREFFLKGVVKTVKVDSANQIADILTKGLDTVQHLELVKRLGMFDVYQVETKGGY
ncbi:ribonuclease H-like domain-containing protein [Tanacetum coccineum]